MMIAVTRRFLRILVQKNLSLPCYNDIAHFLIVGTVL